MSEPAPSEDRCPLSTGMWLALLVFFRLLGPTTQVPWTTGFMRTIPTPLQTTPFHQRVEKYNSRVAEARGGDVNTSQFPQGNRIFLGLSRCARDVFNLARGCQCIQQPLAPPSAVYRPRRPAYPVTRIEEEGERKHLLFPPTVDRRSATTRRATAMRSLRVIYLRIRAKWERHFSRRPTLHPHSPPPPTRVSPIPPTPTHQRTSVRDSSLHHQNNSAAGEICTFSLFAPNTKKLSWAFMNSAFDPLTQGSSNPLERAGEKKYSVGETLPHNSSRCERTVLINPSAGLRSRESCSYLLSWGTRREEGNKKNCGGEPGSKSPLGEPPCREGKYMRLPVRLIKFHVGMYHRGLAGTRRSAAKLDTRLRVAAVGTVGVECRAASAQDLPKAFPMRLGYIPPRSPRWLDYSLHTQRESCRTMSLVGGFSRVSPVPPPLHSGVAVYLLSFILIGYQDLDIKSRPNLFSHLDPICYHSYLADGNPHPRGSTCRCRPPIRGEITIILALPPPSKSLSPVHCPTPSRATITSSSLAPRSGFSLGGYRILPTPPLCCWVFHSQDYSTPLPTVSTDVKVHRERSRVKVTDIQHGGQRGPPANRNDNMNSSDL
ncbi:hypothetical protein PR048_007900 [Dryococelus australis]|uniref:Uncharacterized protein n=1 Tax=Dryococelus australis TaxID=614101 RepID=A0ABQ9HVR0_9NEOP|nr:hypothetical protein PR048_007900 [Dryococelus australis]